MTAETDVQCQNDNGPEPSPRAVGEGLKVCSWFLAFDRGSVGREPQRVEVAIAWQVTQLVLPPGRFRWPLFPTRVSVKEHPYVPGRFARSKDFAKRPPHCGFWVPEVRDPRIRHQARSSRQVVLGGAELGRPHHEDQQVIGVVVTQPLALERGDPAQARGSGGRCDQDGAGMPVSLVEPLPQAQPRCGQPLVGRDGAAKAAHPQQAYD